MSPPRKAFLEVLTCPDPTIAQFAGACVVIVVIMVKTLIRMPLCVKVPIDGNADHDDANPLQYHFVLGFLHSLGDGRLPGSAWS